jgi:hypothetical protein
MSNEAESESSVPPDPAAVRLEDWLLLLQIRLPAPQLQLIGSLPSVSDRRNSLGR